VSDSPETSTQQVEHVSKAGARFTITTAGHGGSWLIGGGYDIFRDVPRATGLVEP
jgi:hypothetical protein